MTERTRRTRALWLLVVVLSSACASRHGAPIGAGELSPAQTEHEAAKEGATLATTTRALADPALSEYLAKLGDRLLPASMRQAGSAGITFGVIRDPTLNAFALANGRVYLHTGLLASLDNEAQLATILGREMTHVIDRHVLSAARNHPDQLLAATGLAASLAIASGAGGRPKSGGAVGVALLSDTASAVLGHGLYLAASASIEGYQATVEREADVGAMERMVRAGYDPNEARKVFERLKQRAKDGGAMEIFCYGASARLDERIAAMRKLLSTTYAAAASPAAVKDSEEFPLRMRPVVRENAYEDIRAGRFDLAQRQLDRVLAATPDDAVAHLYVGDLHRLQAQRASTSTNRDAEAARAFAAYDRAVALDGALPEPYRALGLLYFQQNDKAKARAAFEQYLASSPHAVDAPRIRGYIGELDR